MVSADPTPGTAGDREPVPSLAKLAFSLLFILPAMHALWALFSAILVLGFSFDDEFQPGESPMLFRVAAVLYALAAPLILVCMAWAYRCLSRRRFGWAAVLAAAANLGPATVFIAMRHS
jgi:hypothetical protein